ncbi:MAG: protein TolR [Candidatus Aminicenantes bacterium]|jgi:biopolymer transport protein TolR|nr:protein TolR [Candidatus Aminicenantes bacterium]
MALKARPTYKRRLGTSLSEINVTPFVDVMLVLLVIFMVTAPMIQSGISVNLPQAETKSTPAEEGLTLTITKDKYIHIENSVINQFLLEQKLKEYFYGKEKKIVFIRADESLPYGFVMRILDISKKAGVEITGLITRPIEPEEKK